MPDVGRLGLSDKSASEDSVDELLDEPVDKPRLMAARRDLERFVRLLRLPFSSKRDAAAVRTGLKMVARDRSNCFCEDKRLRPVYPNSPPPPKTSMFERGRESGWISLADVGSVVVDWSEWFVENDL